MSEKWKQGKLLITNNTEKWNQLLKEDMDKKEKKQVFVNFHDSDFGKSRKRICICDTADNARLIAAAPEMLHALINICKSDEYDYPEDMQRIVVHNLIEKATGKTWKEVINE